MDIQELYLRSYEFFLEQDSEPITDLEYQFTIDRLNILASKESLSSKEQHDTTVLFSILLNFDKENVIDSLKLSDEMKKILDEL